MILGFDKSGRLTTVRGQRPAPLRERDIERTCSDWLALDGWRCIKTDPCSDRARGKGFGEKGMADCLYLRYPYSKPVPHLLDGLTFDPVARTRSSNVMWIEWKSTKGKVRPHQLEWHRNERGRGALTLIAGVDFPASIDGFMEYYRGSGLLRRRGL